MRTQCGETSASISNFCLVIFMAWQREDCQLQLLANTESAGALQAAWLDHLLDKLDLGKGM